MTIPGPCCAVTVKKRLLTNRAYVAIVTGFWKTYHLHTSEIIRISDFEPLWL